MNNDVHIVNEYRSRYIFDLKIDFEKYPLMQHNITVLDRICRNNPSRIMIKNGKAIAILTIMLMHKGVANIFLLTDRRCQGDIKKTFFKNITKNRIMLDDIARQYGLHRIETVCYDEPRYSKFMEYFGFQKECVKEKFGSNGEDFILWSKLWVQKQQ